MIKSYKDLAPRAIEEANDLCRSLKSYGESSKYGPFLSISDYNQVEVDVLHKGQALYILTTKEHMSYLVEVKAAMVALAGEYMNLNAQMTNALDFLSRLPALVPENEKKKRIALIGSMLRVLRDLEESQWFKHAEELTDMTLRPKILATELVRVLEKTQEQPAS